MGIEDRNFNGWGADVEEEKSEGLRMLEAWSEEQNKTDTNRPERIRLYHTAYAKAAEPNSTPAELRAIYDEILQKPFPDGHKPPAGDIIFSGLLEYGKSGRINQVPELIKLFKNDEDDFSSAVGLAAEYLAKDGFTEESEQLRQAMALE